MKGWSRPLLAITGLLLLWQLVVTGLSVPEYILPAPVAVLARLYTDAGLLWSHALVTLAEMLMALVLGVGLGLVTALCLLSCTRLRIWLLPLLLLTQAMPLFALAPLLMLWLGYGMASKVAAAVLMVFFPVTNSFYDGLRHTNRDWLDLASTLNARSRATLMLVRCPAALPSLASGLRTAVVFVPIGAVAGEWVGSSAGLGYLMMQANARVWVDLLFAALFLLALCTVVLYYLTDWWLRRLISWHKPS